MNVQIKIISGLEEPYVEIYTSDITDDIQNLLSLIKASSNIVTAQQDERTIVLKVKKKNITAKRDYMNWKTY